MYNGFDGNSVVSSREQNYVNNLSAHVSAILVYNLRWRVMQSNPSQLSSYFEGLDEKAKARYKETKRLR